MQYTLDAQDFEYFDSHAGTPPFSDINLTEDDLEFVIDRLEKCTEMHDGMLPLVSELKQIIETESQSKRPQMARLLKNDIFANLYEYWLQKRLKEGKKGGKEKRQA